MGVLIRITGDQAYLEKQARTRTELKMPDINNILPYQIAFSAGSNQSRILPILGIESTSHISRNGDRTLTKHEHGEVAVNRFSDVEIHD